MISVVPRQLSLAAVAVALLSSTLAASATTATPTDGAPAPGATVTPTPRPLPVVTIAPNPARGGQRVTLDGSASDGIAGQWSQVGDGPALAIENADMFVASFVAPAVVEPTEVRVRMTLSTFGGPTFREYSITILPPDAVRLTVGTVSGPPGATIDVGVALDPLGLAVDRLSHELGFEPEAAIADRGDGTPDCDPGLGLAIQEAGFEFLPAGCVATHSCTVVRAEIVAAQPIVAETVVYTCRIALSAEPAESCMHALSCAGGSASAAASEPLALVCADGTATSAFAQTDPEISLTAEPAEPSVGENVHLAFAITGSGGIPRYDLYGTSPFLDGPTTATANTLGDVAFDLQARRGGTVRLQLSMSYEVAGGCPGQQFFYFRYAISPVFQLTIRDPNGRRVSGRVAEFPLGCQGAMRGVTVTLDPGGFRTQTDLAAGEFTFDGISPGDYTLAVTPGCNPFGCWLSDVVQVAADDVSLTVCPLAAQCIGDCNGDRRVSIDEIIAGVGRALGDPAAISCSAFDVNQSSGVQVDELVGAVGAALEGCEVLPGVTLTPTQMPTPMATPTSCRAVAPRVAEVTSPTDALEQTIYLCGIYYASSLVNVEGPTGEPIDLYEVPDCPLQCPDSRQQCRAADVPLLPGVRNTIRVCQVAGIGCGVLPNLCREVEIEQRASVETGGS